MGYRLWVIGGMALILSACGTTSKAPLDDAYFQPEKLPGSTSYTSTSSSTSTYSSNNEPGPTIEYLNVQDTTVTIRIRK